MNCKRWVRQVGHGGNKKEIRNFILEMQSEETICETEVSHPRKLTIAMTQNLTILTMIFQNEALKVWIGFLVQDRVQLWALVKMVTNLWVP
jgi:hypothetical protein